MRSLHLHLALMLDDPLYVDFYDPDHSDDEERYLIVGESNRGRLLIVSYQVRLNTCDKTNAEIFKNKSSEKFIS